MKKANILTLTFLTTSIILIILGFENLVFQKNIEKMEIEEKIRVQTAQVIKGIESLDKYEMESMEGAGTKFTVVLPLLKREA